MTEDLRALAAAVRATGVAPAAPPPCCAAAAAGDGPGVDPWHRRWQRTAGPADPRLSPVAALSDWLPCRFDCAEAARAREATLAAVEARDPALGARWRRALAAPLLTFGARCWFLLDGEPDGEGVTLRGVLAADVPDWAVPGPPEPGPGRLAAALAAATRVEVAGRVVRVAGPGGEEAHDVSAWALRPALWRWGAEPVGRRPVRVAALDLARAEIDFGGDFAGPRELLFAAGDLRWLGHEPTVLRVTTGVLGQEWTEALEARVLAAAGELGAEVLLAKTHVSDRLVAALRARGVRTVFLAGHLVRPPDGAYDLVVEARARFGVVEAVERLGRGGPLAAPGPAPPPPAAGPPQPFAHPRLYWPETRFRDAWTGEERPYPRFRLVTHDGCPYGAPILANPRFAGLALDPATVSLHGCSFCEMGGDYRKLPVEDYVGFLCGQVEWLVDRAPSAEIIVDDEAAFDWLGRLLEGLVARGARDGTLLVKARVEGLLKRMDRFRAGLAKARGTNLRVVVFLIGLESFADEDLALYNKGVTAADLLACVDALDALEAGSGGAFSFRTYQSHGFVLFNPWSTLETLEANVAVFRRPEIRDLSAKAPFSRLRMYRWQPLYALAIRDGLVADEVSDGLVADEVSGAPAAGGAPLRRHLGYATDEVRWRFVDPRAALVYALVSAGVEQCPPRHTDETFAILAEAVAYARALDGPPGDPAAHVPRFLADGGARFRVGAAGARRRGGVGVEALWAEQVAGAWAALEARSARLPWRLEGAAAAPGHVVLTARHRRSGRALAAKVRPRVDGQAAYVRSRRWEASWLAEAGPPERSGELVLRSLVLLLDEGGGGPGAPRPGAAP